MTREELTPEQIAAAAEAQAARSREYGIAHEADCNLRTAATAITLADEYAPDAPIDLRNEAAVRAAAWLRDVSPSRSSETETYESGRSRSRQYRPAAANPLRASGGMAILAKYVVRRAV